MKGRPSYLPANGQVVSSDHMVSDTMGIAAKTGLQAPAQSMGANFNVQAMNMNAGISGPSMDVEAAL